MWMDFNSMVGGVVRGVSKVNRCEQREYKGLEESHQQLQKIHEYHKGGGENPHARSGGNGCATVTENKDQTRKGEDDDVPC